MKKRMAFITFGLAAIMAVGLAGCGSSSGTAEESTTSSGQTSSDVSSGDAEETHKIAVAIYSDTDDQVIMFKEYYKEYLESSFPVEFYYSSTIQSLEDAETFVDEAKEEGCEGLISFYNNDIEALVDYCGDDMYYVTASSSSVDDEVFEAVKTKSNYLGAVGQSAEDETESAKQMIETLAGDDGASKSYLLLSGGTLVGNYMHTQRTLEMMRVLQDEYGFTFTNGIETVPEESGLIATSAEGGKVYLATGYFLDSEDDLVAALAQDNFDVIASVFGVSPHLETLLAKENEQNSDIQIGTIDCFSENNETAFREKDAFGNSQINFVAGKCKAMAAPAFVAMYNAVTGHADVVLDNGEPTRVRQGFWYADSNEDYEEKISAAENVYDNVYTVKDLMGVLGEYTADADFTDYENFVAQIEQ